MDMPLRLPAALLAVAVLAGWGSDAPAGPERAPTRAADAETDGTTAAEAATSADAAALAALLDPEYADSQSYPRTHAALMRLVEQSDFAFSDDNVVQNYGTYPDVRGVPSLSFCVADPTTRTWTYYDSIEDVYTTSSEGLVCQPLAASQ
ncbi:hypothetical protein [Nocardioides salarius]|uniref:hypothetical protein n=1 Tax=Nocardioides salarius TaxID=374513 RepID=UPI0030FA584B